MELIWQEILTHVVGFTILLVLLKRLAWKPLLGLLDQRQATMQRGLDDVARAKREMEQLQSDYQQRIAAIEEEARGRLQAAVAEGRRMAMDIQEQARAQAQSILTKARDSMALEITQAKLELRDHVVELTLAACRKLLREQLDEAKDREMLLDFIQELNQVEQSPAPRARRSY